MFAGGSQGGLIDDIDGNIVLVAKGRDVFGAGVPSHFSATALKSFNECDSLVRGHVETVDK